MPVRFSHASTENIQFSYTPGDTILSLLKKNFKAHKNDPFIYDAMTGMMTRDEFILKSYVIGEYIKSMKQIRKNPPNPLSQGGTNKIGIMLPALSASSLLLVGSYLAGKLPVMLNWTV